jgi:hypothetical protein
MHSMNGGSSVLTLWLSGIINTKAESPCDALYAIYESGMWRANE